MTRVMDTGSTLRHPRRRDPRRGRPQRRARHPWGATSDRTAQHHPHHRQCLGDGSLLKSSPDDFQSELVRARERGRGRAGEGSVRYVSPIAIRGMSRCRHAYRVVWFRASAPEFGELPGKGSALVTTRSSGGRPRRQIHQIAAECVAGVAIRQNRFDSAAARA
jgi:hypothetical protein